MRIGIFAKTFPRPTLAETLDAVAATGLTDVQFNMSCAGRPTLPEAFEPEVCAGVAREFAARGLTMSAVSGTFNTIHPDPRRRAEELRRFRNLLASCGDLGTSVVTLCTGTRDPDDMWAFHPGNREADAWDDLLRTLGRALAWAEDFGVTLAIEPEVANVVDSAGKARKLLDTLASPRLKVVIDPANLFHAGDLPKMGSVLADAFDQLGPDLVLAHAKDLSRDGHAGDMAAGTGRLDYPLYLSLLKRSGYAGALVLHGLREDQVAGSLAFLRRGLDAVGMDVAG